MKETKVVQLYNGGYIRKLNLIKIIEDASKFLK
jgi:hypothetical protein